MATTKTDIWTPIISIVAIILLVSTVVNITTNWGVKSKLKESTKKEITLLKEMQQKTKLIDSLEVEINRRDDVIAHTVITEFTLQQFKDKYEKNRNNISNMPLDSAISYFAKQVGN